VVVASAVDTVAACRSTRPGSPYHGVACAGFSLFELLVAMLIAALILGIASPSFRDFQRSRRLTAVANDLLSMLQLARTEAVKRQKVVSLCPSADHSTCTGKPDFAAWIVFEDQDPNGTCQPPAGVPPIRAQTEISPEQATNFSARANFACIAFQPTGFAPAIADPAGEDRVLICDQRGISAPGLDVSIARGLVISATGRAWVTRSPATLTSWGLKCPGSTP
jgi:type IV fimbrial biogenesis protein FimT